MSSISNLLPKNSHNRRKREMEALKNKWKRTGLLEGLNDMQQGNIAQLLENQAKQLVTEANRTSTAQNSEEWAGIALPLIRRIFGETVAEEFVSVQPMNLPNGLVFWLEFKYGTGQPGFDTGKGKDSQQDSIWGVSDARKGTPMTGGLYGAGRFGYTINDYSSSAITILSGSTPNFDNGTGSVEPANLTTDINYNSEFSASVVNAAEIIHVFVPVPEHLINADLLGARAFTIMGTGIEEVYNEYTYVDPNEKFVRFLVSGSLTAKSDLVAFYHKQPTDITRGDFEELKTQEDPLDIPELNLEFNQETIVAKTRKLKAQWTPEFAQDINAYHNIDAEAELTSVLGEYISKEIDLEILDMLYHGAQSENFWSARLGYEYDKTTQSFVQTAANASSYNQGTWFQTLGTKIQKMSNRIGQLTMRGGANFIVVSPEVATVLESIPGYAADTAGDKDKFGYGSQKIGTINNRFQVYKLPYLTTNTMLMGYRGAQYLETGAVYSPYIPLLMTPTVLDPDNFTPRKGVMTRYAKKLLRPEFYAKIHIEGLDHI